MCLKRVLISISLIIALIFALEFSYIYEAQHTVHECTHERCPVCYELIKVKQLIKTLVTCVVFAFILFFNLEDITKVICLYKRETKFRTLIIDNIRMND